MFSLSISKSFLLFTNPSLLPIPMTESYCLPNAEQNMPVSSGQIQTIRCNMPTTMVSANSCEISENSAWRLSGRNWPLDFYLHIMAFSYTFDNWGIEDVTHSRAHCLPACDSTFLEVYPLSCFPHLLHSEKQERGASFTGVPLALSFPPPCCCTGLRWKPSDVASALRSHCAFPVRPP